MQNTNVVFSLREFTDALEEAAVAFLRIAPCTPQALPWKICALAAAANTPLWPVLPTLLYWCNIYQFCFLVCGVEAADETVDAATSWDVSSLVSTVTEGTLQGVSKIIEINTPLKLGPSF